MLRDCIYSTFSVFCDHSHAQCHIHNTCSCSHSHTGAPMNLQGPQRKGKNYTSRGNNFRRRAGVSSLLKDPSRTQGSIDDINTVVSISSSVLKFFFSLSIKHILIWFWMFSQGVLPVQPLLLFLDQAEGFCKDRDGLACNWCNIDKEIHPLTCLFFKPHVFEMFWNFLLLSPPGTPWLLWSSYSSNKHFSTSIKHNLSVKKVAFHSNRTFEFALFAPVVACWASRWSYCAAFHLNGTISACCRTARFWMVSTAEHVTKVATVAALAERIDNSLTRVASIGKNRS